MTWFGFLAKQTIACSVVIILQFSASLLVVGLFHYRCVSWGHCK